MEGSYKCDRHETSVFFVGNVLKIKTKHRVQVEANVETSVFFVGNIL